VYRQDRLQIGGSELDEGLVAQDARVVDDDVDLAEAVERGLDDRLAPFGRRHRVVACDGGPPGFGDLLHRRIGHARATTGSVGGTTQVVHDDLRTAPCQLERVRLSKSAARAGDHGHPIVESNFTHSRTPSLNGI
jgi:hypothetical protein